jgi:peptide/histidine transporter 3/4
MAVFGAEQIQESKATSHYFSKYYVAVNIGAVIATLSIPLIQTDSDNQPNPNNYFYGYLVAICMLVCAAILFIIGRRYYIHIPPYDTVIMKCIPVIINAFQTRRKYYENIQTIGGNRRNRSTISDEGTVTTDQQSLSFLDFAKAANNGKFNDRIVNDVKSLRRAIFVFLLLIPYWLIYYQVNHSNTFLFTFISLVCRCK